MRQANFAHQLPRRVRFGRALASRGSCIFSDLASLLRRRPAFCALVALALQTTSTDRQPRNFPGIPGKTGLLIPPGEFPSGSVAPIGLRCANFSAMGFLSARECLSPLAARLAACLCGCCGPVFRLQVLRELARLQRKNRKKVGEICGGDARRADWREAKLLI